MLLVLYAVLLQLLHDTVRGDVWMKWSRASHQPRKMMLARQRRLPCFLMQFKTQSRNCEISAERNGGGGGSSQSKFFSIQLKRFLGSVQRASSTGHWFPGLWLNDCLDRQIEWITWPFSLKNPIHFPFASCHGVQPNVIVDVHCTGQKWNWLHGSDASAYRSAHLQPRSIKRRRR